MPPPRGSQGYDFTPIFSHYILLFTFILALVGWLTAFIGQAAGTAKFGHASIGTGWFAIFLQLFVILGAAHTLASDAIAMHRFQLSIFTAAAMVFAVIEVNQTIFSSESSLEAVGAGWLLLAVVDILWTLYFTSEEGSLPLHLFNSMGTGGLTPPGRHSRRATMNRQSQSGIPNNGYGGGGIGGGAGYGGGVGGGPVTSGYGGTLAGNGNNPNTTRSMSGGGLSGMGMGGGNELGVGAPTNNSTAALGGANAPLMSGTGTGIGDTSAGSHQTTGPTGGDGEDSEGFAYRAKALYAYTASADDPNEISFAKGEILDILDNAGKWWQARKADGTRGIAPSNYLQIM